MPEKEMTDNMINKAVDSVIYWTKTCLTSLRKWRDSSDFQRWRAAKSLSPSWDSRTKQISTLIDDHTSVIEFGAGRLVLKTFLPSGCTYTPSDLVDRGDGTIVCDLNSDSLPEFQSYDFAVFSGVLEYVNDVPRLILHLSKFVNTIIASYAVVELNNSGRREAGWVNDLSSIDFIKAFENAGFHCEHQETWSNQIIYKFRRRPDG